MILPLNFGCNSDATWFNNGFKYDLKKIVEYISNGSTLVLKENQKNKFLILVLDNMVEQELFKKTVTQKWFSYNIVKYHKI